MSVYKAIRKDLGTGSITGSSQQTYTVPFYVFTDNLTSPKDIYKQACSAAGIIVYTVNNIATTE